jgi:hypothetical protein
LEIKLFFPKFKPILNWMIQRKNCKTKAFVMRRQKLISVSLSVVIIDSNIGQIVFLPLTTLTPIIINFLNRLMTGNSLVFIKFNKFNAKWNGPYIADLTFRKVLSSLPVYDGCKLPSAYYRIALEM